MTHNNKDLHAPSRPYGAPRSTPSPGWPNGLAAVFEQAQELRRSRQADGETRVDVGPRVVPLPGDHISPELRLRWSLAMLEYPWWDPKWQVGRGPWVLMLNGYAQNCRAGYPLVHEAWIRYADHWHELGFTPDMYLVLQLRLATARVDDQRLAQALNLDGKRGVFGSCNLNPEHWKAFPHLLGSMRAQAAVSWIITGEDGLTEGVRLWPRPGGSQR